MATASPPAKSAEDPIVAPLFVADKSGAVDRIGIQARPFTLPGKVDQLSAAFTTDSNTLYLPRTTYNASAALSKSTRGLIAPARLINATELEWGSGATRNCLTGPVCSAL